MTAAVATNPRTEELGGASPPPAPPAAVATENGDPREPNLYRVLQELVRRYEAVVDAQSVITRMQGERRVLEAAEAIRAFLRPGPPKSSTVNLDLFFAELGMRRPTQ